MTGRGGGEREREAREESWRRRERKREGEGGSHHAMSCPSHTPMGGRGLLARLRCIPEIKVISHSSLLPSDGGHAAAEAKRGIRTPLQERERENRRPPSSFPEKPASFGFSVLGAGSRWWWWKLVPLPSRLGGRRRHLGHHYLERKERILPPFSQELWFKVSGTWSRCGMIIARVRPSQ